MPVTIGVLKETVRGENRVAVVPEVATRLAALGAKLLIERGAGAAARFPDAATRTSPLPIPPTRSLPPPTCYSRSSLPIRLSSRA